MVQAAGNGKGKSLWSGAGEGFFPVVCNGCRRYRLLSARAQNAREIRWYRALRVLKPGREAFFLFPRSIWKFK